MGRMQLRKLQCCIWSDSIKPSVRFSWFCVFFVSKGNPFWLLISIYYSHLSPNLMLWLTLSDSNYLYLEQISMVHKTFEPLWFDCVLYMCAMIFCLYIFSSPELCSGLVIVITFCPSPVRLCVCPLTFSKDLSEATEPILLKFHKKPP